MARILSSKRTIVLDGASGTHIKTQYPDLGSEEVSVRDPELVYNIHKDYLDVGARIILTNTFGVNLKHYSKPKAKTLIRSSVRIAKRVVKKRGLTAGDIGPSGELPEPLGDKKLESLISDFKFIARTLATAGVDILYLESFTSLIEARAAVIAARDLKRPVFVTLTFDDSLRTPFGDLPESCLLVLEGLGAQAVGVNCTTPEITIAVLKKMRSVSSIPLIAKPNAGIPAGDHFTYNTRKMASFIPELTRVADLVGGCCGTTPDFIRMVSRKRRMRKRDIRRKPLILAVPQRTVRLDHTTVVGERINPTGRRRLTQALKKKDYDYIVREAKEQEDFGAEAIDVNLFVPLLNEKNSMVNVVRRLVSRITVPIFIDTRDYDAAIAGLTIFPGICAINSVPVIKKELRRWLPLAQRFGAYVVVSLCSKTLPKTAGDRMRLYRQAKQIARGLRFPTDHLIYDPLVFPIATAPDQIGETLETVSLLKRAGELSILGISNISYGLPDRSTINGALTANAIRAGATFIIANPFDEKVKDAVIGSRILFEGKIVKRKIIARPDTL
ncbi:MAG TPA: hypothetical protein EYP58_05735, partial [bacterium (Candidatus Stahlbacteria)]|nr:hypothetical protein [Candidatus Stahlbacteria bacterium]